MLTHTLNNSNPIRPLKQFGQNYLQDKNILRKIVEEIQLQETDVVVEIGPGKGALTEFLYSAVPTLTAVEIDTRVTEELRERFPLATILQQDFRDFDIERFAQEKNSRIRFVGNIPYNITSTILFALMNAGEYVKDATFLVQLEVAERITAKPGTKQFGILGALIGAFGTSRLCFKVSPNVFYPKPKVWSAVVTVAFNEVAHDPVFREYYIKIVKAAFNKRRKTLRNSFKESPLNDILTIELPVDLSLRAEQLTIEDFLAITSSYKQFKQE